MSTPNHITEPANPAAISNIINDNSTSANVQPMETTGSDSTVTPEHSSLESMVDQIRNQVTNGSYILAQSIVSNAPRNRITAMREELQELSNTLEFLVGLQHKSSLHNKPQQSSQIRENLIPTNLPVWQFNDHVWKPNAESYDSLDNFLNRFEDILEANMINIDKNWSRLMPVSMHPDQREWFVNNLKGKPCTWKEAVLPITKVRDKS
jgi:hypothetical protein